MKTYVHLLYLAEFFLDWEMFQTKIVEIDQNKRFIFNNFLSRNFVDPVSLRMKIQ
jgi:hypothetical protein